MARQGLNCTLSYVGAGGKTYAYRVRTPKVSSGFEMIASESQARASRAFYPRKTAPTQFSVVVDLIGARERDSLNRYLMTYVQFILDPSIKGQITPQMTVRVPSRGFVREGVPVGGLEFGTYLGEMVFKPTLVFEISREPVDWNASISTSIVQSDLAEVRSSETRYFYPTGVQLRGGQSPAIQAAVNGTGASGSDGLPGNIPDFMP